MKFIHAYYRLQVEEIRRDPTVRAFFWPVLLGHVVVWIVFVTTGLPFVATTQTEPLCWPYFQACYRFRLSVPAMCLLLLAHLGLLIAAATALWHGRHSAAWRLTLGINLLLFAVVSLDYRLRANEFYMLFWLNLVFLAWPNKRWSVPLVLISFYFWAGALKLNGEWLSGAALYHPLWLVPSSSVPAACAYVVILEMLMIWGLASHRSWLKWATLGQLSLFHVQSLSQIHWFYPVLMGTMLAWFVLEQIHGATCRAPLLIRGRAPAAAYTVFLLFGSFQLLPFLYGGNRALTGQGRYLALHMFEAKQVCTSVAVLHRVDAADQTIDLVPIGFPPRAVCDPVIHYGEVMNICRSRVYDPGLVDVDFQMQVRRTIDVEMRTIVDERNFCGRELRMSAFLNTSWIR